MPQIQEKRRTTRQRVYQSGRIVYGDGVYTLGCSIVERSEKGARIRLVDNEPLPSNFHLIDVVKGLAHEAKIVWLRFPNAGVIFGTSHALSDPLPQGRQYLVQIWKAAAGR